MIIFRALHQKYDRVYADAAAAAASAVSGYYSDFVAPSSHLEA